MPCSRRNSRLPGFATIAAIAIASAFPASPARADTISKAGLFNKKHPQCNVYKSFYGWHMVASSFEGTTNLTAPAMKRANFIYLVYDPMLAPYSDISKTLPQERVRHQYHSYKTAFYKGRWPIFFNKPVVGELYRPGKPMFGLQVTMDKTRLFVVDPRGSRETSVNAIKPERIAALFTTPPPSGDNVVLALKIGLNEPVYLPVEEQALLRQRKTKLRGKMRLAGHDVLKSRVFSYSVNTYTQSLWQLTKYKLTTQRTYNLSEESKAILQLFYNRTSTGTAQEPLTYALGQDGRWFFGEQINSFGPAKVATKIGMSHYKKHFLSTNC
ncbi:MAG: hypothetical protein AAF127_14460 [Pseudomonadota bacterium]